MNQVLAPPSTARGWLVVGLLFFAGALLSIDRSLISVMRSSIMEEIPMTESQFGFLMAIYTWVYAFLSPFLGFLADRLNRSAVLSWSLLLWSLVTMLTAYAETYDQLLACRVALAITEASYLPCALALITDYHRGSTRSRATSVHIVGISIGAALSGVGGMLATRYSWQMPYTYFGLAGMVLSGVLICFLRDPPRATADARTAVQVTFGRGLASLFGYRSFTIVFLYFGLAALATGGLHSWLPTYLKEHFQMTQGAAGLAATGYINIAAMVGLLIGGVWADHWCRTNSRGNIFVACIALAVSAPCVLLITANSFGWAMLGLSIFGLSYSVGGVQTMPILCQVTDPRYRSTAYGVLNLLAASMSGLGTYACGAMRDAHIDFKWYVFTASAILVVCSMLLFRIKPLPQANAGT